MSNVILAGLGKGISCAIATSLKSEGYSIFATSRTEKGKKLAKSLKIHYGRPMADSVVSIIRNQAMTGQILEIGAGFSLKIEKGFKMIEID